MSMDISEEKHVKHTRLRIIWMIPYILFVIANVVLVVFVFSLWNELIRIKRHGVFLMISFLLFIVNIYGGVTLRSWMNQGKI